MNKQEMLDLMGLVLREVNEEDRKMARTTYQRRANYILELPNGVEYYCKNGTTKEILGFVRLSMED